MDTQNSVSSTIEIVEFQLQKRTESGEIKHSSYGIEVSKISEVIRLPQVTENPKASEFTVGVFKTRGKLASLIQLSKWLGSTTKNITDNQFVIVTDFDSKLNGFLVDGVSRIHRIPMNELEPVDDISLMEENTEYVLGAVSIDEKIVFVLDFEKVVQDINAQEHAVLNTDFQAKELSHV